MMKKSKKIFFIFSLYTFIQFNVYAIGFDLSKKPMLKLERQSSESSLDFSVDSFKSFEKDNDNNFEVKVDFDDKSSDDPSLNLTEEFKKIYMQTIAKTPFFDSEKFIKLASKYNIVFVGGLLSGMGKLGKQKNFATQAHFLSNLGLKEGKDFSFAPINSFQTVDFNVEIIKKTIEKSEKPVILIGHSMGGLGSVGALAKYPELQEKVKGIITFQSPFHGSEAADAIDEAKTKRAAYLKILIKNLLTTPLMWLSGGHRGTYQTMECLTTKARKKVLEENEIEIRKMISKIPVINLVGWTAPLDEDLLLENNNPEVGIGMHTRFHGIRVRHHNDKDNLNYFPNTTGGAGTLYSKIIKNSTPLLTERGITENDLIVPKYSQHLFNSYYINLKGLDHISMVMASSHNQIEKVRATASILQILLQKIEDQKN